MVIKCPNCHENQLIVDMQPKQEEGRAERVYKPKGLCMKCDYRVEVKQERWNL